MEMYEIHESVFNICFDKYVDSGAQVKFALRKSNRFDRLLHGHWFYGNENYAAISFWSGSDWKNKTPNIFFGVDKNGYSFLELTASDSEKKKSFFNEILSTKINGLKPFRNGWKKNYHEFGNNFQKSLESFLYAEKNLIDFWIKTTANDFFNEDENTFNRIGPINDDDFEKRLKIVSKYRKNFNPKNIRKRIPEHLKSFHFTRSFPKMKIEISDLPNNAQWIFFTGMNGTGKTNILRGLTSSILDNYDNYFLINDGTFKAEIEIVRNNRIYPRETSLNDLKRKRLTKGFAAYGSSRLSVMDFPEGKEFNSEQVAEKSTSSYSLFHNDGILFTIDPIFLNYVENPFFKSKMAPYLGTFMHQIVELLPEIIPNLVTINIPQKSTSVDLWSLIEYVEEDENGEELPPVEFDDLSSGAKSMVAMFGDMLVRLFSQQPKTENISELIGIVLIDEIDVHLHPIIQRTIVEKLSGIFPKIQFIATTHSPVPLLGAPKGSVFYKVVRTAENGISVKRLKELEDEIENLLPNTILTSPIFGMDSLIPQSNTDKSKLIVDDNYSDFVFMEHVEKKIEELFHKKDNNDLPL